MANIVFKDAKVKEICVQNWGSNGEITYEQAAAVTDLWGKFKEYANSLPDNAVVALISGGYSIKSGSASIISVLSANSG